MYFVFLAAIALERVFELFVARRNARRAFDRGAIEVGRAHYRVMTVFHTLFLVACAAETVAFDRSFSPVVGSLMLGAAIAAQALRYWSIRALGDRWNTRIIVLPEAPPVVSGPYRFVRHPNYVAVAVEMVAIPMVMGNVLTAAVFSLGNAALLTVRIRAEEAALGAGYRAAFERTPRFVP
jgi:methyltransferase